jgi:hypothetical protein
MAPSIFYVGLTDDLRDRLRRRSAGLVRVQSRRLDHSPTFLARKHPYSKLPIRIDLLNTLLTPFYACS